MNRLRSAPGTLSAVLGLVVLLIIGSSFVPQTVTGVRQIASVGRSPWPPPPSAIVNLDDLVDEGRYENLNLTAGMHQTIYTVPPGKCLVLLDFALRGSPGDATLQDTQQLGLRELGAMGSVRKLRRGIIVSGWDGPGSGSTGFHSSLGVVFRENRQVVLYVNDTPPMGTAIEDIRVEAFNGYLVDC